MLRIDPRKERRAARVVTGAVAASLVLYLVIAVLAKTGHLESIGRAWGGDAEVVAQLPSSAERAPVARAETHDVAATTASRRPRGEGPQATQPTDARSPGTHGSPPRAKGKRTPGSPATPAPQPAAPAAPGNTSEEPAPGPTPPEPVVPVPPVDVPPLPEPPLPPVPELPPLPVTPPELPAPPALPVP